MFERILGQSDLMKSGMAMLRREFDEARRGQYYTSCFVIPAKINKVANEYTPDRITTLLDWHDAHKVTEHERHRNAAIFKEQGNRNPLIDKPNLGRKIDFLQELG